MSELESSWSGKVAAIKNKQTNRQTKVDELIFDTRTDGQSMSLQTKTMCCQCDYHSYVNDLAKPKT